MQDFIRSRLAALGEDPSRDGLLRTPERVEKAWAELTRGYAENLGDIVRGAIFTVESNNMVVVRDIDVFSHCEHHLALMYDMTVSVAYFPKGKVIGLSKIARIADMAARRLQLQERLCADIAYIIQKVCGTEDVIVIIEGEQHFFSADFAFAVAACGIDGSISCDELAVSDWCGCAVHY